MKSTSEARKLYHALKKAGVPAFLEKWDGYKHIDIAIPEAKINIEIDGGHHNYNSKQALADLKRTYHSFKKQYFTLRLPNSIIKNHFNEAVDLIIEILNESNDQLEEDSWS
jgi:very-short-patch-repair endonuclease